MVASKISTSDINNLAQHKLVVTLPDFAAVESAKNLVTRVKSRYPLENGQTFTTKTDKATNTITIEVVRPEDVNRKNK